MNPVNQSSEEGRSRITDTPRIRSEAAGRVDSLAAIWPRAYRHWRTLLVVVGTIGLTACQSPDALFNNDPLEVASPTRGGTNAIIRLHEGDVVKVTFEADTNMNTVAKISMEGVINLPMAGDVKAVGRTIEELQSDLIARYDRLLKVKEITVTLVSSAASVYVSGAVLRPGRIPMDRPLTALDAVMEAGGFDPNRARLSAVSVMRVENGRQRRYEINLKRTLQGGDETPFYLKPFDIVHVPEKTFNF